MNIRINNGKRKITLTKGEMASLGKARMICEELEKQWVDGPWQVGADAATAIGSVLLELQSDASQSEPEAAATK